MSEEPYACGSWIFIKRRGFESSLKHVLPKLSKVTVTCSKSVKTNRVNFDLPKVSKITINFELLKVGKWLVWKSAYIFSHGEARIIKFRQQIITWQISLSQITGELLLSNLKASVCYFLTNFYLSWNDTPSKTMKGVFDFI